jgi:hypothetical protein
MGVSGFDPASLGPIFSWVKGDDASLDEGVIYDSLTDMGSVGGSFVAATDAQPVAVEVGGKTAPVFRGKRRAVSSAANTAWQLLNDTTSSATLSFRFRAYGVGGTNKLFNTFTEAGNQIGFSLRLSGGRLRVVTGNGSATLAAPWSNVTIVADTWHTCQVTKSGSSYSISVDGETPVTATGNTVDAPPQYAAILGNWSGGDVPLDGLIPEVVIHSTVLNSAELAQMRDYMASQWSATPAFSLHAFGDVALHVNADTGVTLGTGVSAVRDLSGYNNDLAQATPANQLALVSSWRNGRAAFQGGAGQWLQNNGFNQGPANQPNSIFAAIEHPGSGAATRLFDAPVSRQIFQTATVLQQYAGAFSGTIAAPSAGSAGVMRLKFDDTASDQTHVINGASTVSETTSPGVAGLNGLYLGGTAGSSSFLGKFAEFIVFMDAPDATGDAAILAHLQSTYDIAPL